MTHTAAYDANALYEPAEAGPSGWLREVTVHLSMMIVVAALGMVLRTSFGFGATPSIVIALTIYWGLLIVHALVRRGQAAAELSAEVAHLADENASLRRLVGARRPEPVGARRPAEIEREPPRLAGATGERPPPRIMAPNAGGARPLPPETAKPQPAPQPAKAAPPLKIEPSANVSPAKGTLEDAKAAPRAGDVVAPKAKPEAAPAPVAPKPAAGPAKRPPPAAASPRTIPPPLPARPRPQGLAALAVERPAARQPIDASPGTAEAEDPRAADVAIMQSLIKGLADQLNGPMAKPVPARAAPPPPPVQRPQAPPRDAAPAPPRHEAAAPPLRDTIEEQVGALRGMADAMRTLPSVRPADSMEPGRSFAVEDELADAIEASRVDVYLDPILGLDDHRARHFEVSVRLRREDGESMDPRALASAIAGTGLGPRIEALTFTESLRLAGEFAARGSSADLFSTASGESLRDGGFHAALSGALAPDVALGARLVMSISQAEVRAFGPAHWEALAALAQAGLRYALVDVVDLDMDFEGLAIRGFEFVRLDAPVFLQGLPASHGFVPSADLCRHLSGFGFTLIVGRIGEERELVKVLGFGALLGQGRLFGGPRPIRQDRGAHRPTAASPSAA